MNITGHWSTSKMCYISNGSLKEQNWYTYIRACIHTYIHTCVHMYVCMYWEVVQRGIRLGGSGSPTMAVSWSRDRESSCSLHKAGCLSGPNLVLKAWGIAGELRVCSLYWNPKETGPTLAKEYPRDRIEELAGNGESKQAESKASIFHVLLIWVSAKRCHPGLEWAFQLHITCSRTLSHWSARQLEFHLIPGAVRLTAKMSYLKCNSSGPKCKFPFH